MPAFILVNAFLGVTVCYVTLSKGSRRASGHHQLCPTGGISDDQRQA